MHAGADQRIEANTRVVAATRTDGIAQQRDLQAGGQGGESGLINADRRLKATEQEMADAALVDERGADAVISESGEGGLAPCGGLRGESEELRRGAAEFLGGLLGEGHGQSEPDRGGDGEGAAALEPRAVFHRCDEFRLEINAQ